MSNLASNVDQILTRSKAAFDLFKNFSGKQKAVFLDAIALALKQTVQPSSNWR